ncbi:MAG: SRPBCC family protein [Spirochaetota bacterium]
MESFEIKATFPVTQEELFAAWLDGEVHGEMVGAGAEINGVVGGRFSISDGYITGETVELVPNKKIVQHWRTTEFPEGAEDSILEITLESSGKETTMRMVHTRIPDGQGDDYKKGWQEYYFTPMKEYFEKKASF